MECDVCLIEWDVVVHIPRILSCGHTICEACLISMLKSATSKNTEMFCPSCMKKQKKIKDEEDIKKLIKNINLLRISEKIESRKSSNCQSFLTSRDNLNFSIFSKNLNSSRFNNDTTIFGTNELICKNHCLQIHSYAIGSNNYLCDLCIKENPNVKSTPMPNFIKETKRKIDSSEIKLCLAKQELERLQEFYHSYLEEFESTNLSKIDDMFQYMNKLIVYNYNTAKTVVQQCKKEQENHIETRMSELNALINELKVVENKLSNFAKNERDEKFLVSHNEELTEVYNKVNNFVNYEMEINLFQMNIGIKEDIRERMFEFLQNSYYVDVDYVTINNNPPSIKHVLQKEKLWNCICGENDNPMNEVKCINCGIFRKLESFENLLASPLSISKEEVNLLNMRRKKEINDFQVLYKDHKSGSSINTGGIGILNKENKSYVIGIRR